MGREQKSAEMRRAVEKDSDEHLGRGLVSGVGEDWAVMGGEGVCRRP